LLDAFDGKPRIDSLSPTNSVLRSREKLLDGGIALVCEEGLIMTDEVSVTGG
jgi:hypothetical protein